MTDAKRRIQRQELMDRIAIINDRIKSHLSQAQRADTHFDACTQYAEIQRLADMAHFIVTQIEQIDAMPIQEKMR